jgi:hypothetical protein
VLGAAQHPWVKRVKYKDIVYMVYVWVSDNNIVEPGYSIALQVLKRTKIGFTTVRAGSQIDRYVTIVGGLNIGRMAMLYVPKYDLCAVAHVVSIKII